MTTIELNEFEYFNNRLKKKIIPIKKLKEFKEKLKRERTASSRKDVKFFWTNKTFANNCIGFSIQQNAFSNPSITMTNFSEKLNPEEFCNCVDTYNNLYFSYKLTDQDKKFIDEFFSDQSNRYRDFATFKKIDSYKQLINFTFENNYFQNEVTNNSTINEINKTIQELFDVEALTVPEIVSDDRYSYNKTLYLARVLERRIKNKNYRLGFFIDLSDINCYSGDPENKVNEYNLRCYCVSEDNELYTLFDETNIFNFYRKFSESIVVSLDSIELDTNNKLIIKEKVLEKIENNRNDILPPNQRLVSKQVYLFYSNRINLKMEDSLLSMQEQKLLEQYQIILNEDRTIKIGDVVINKDSITLGDSFKLEPGENFFNIKAKFLRIKKAVNIKEASYNYNLIYEKLLKLSQLDCIRSNDTKDHRYLNLDNSSFTINGMKINLVKKGYRWNINGHFCRIDDVYPILTKAICYGSVEDFNKFVEEVSHVGYRWIRLISDTIPIEISSPIASMFESLKIKGEEKLCVRFNLLWDPENRNNIYLYLNDKKYLIQKKSSFLNYFDKPNVYTDMYRLKSILNETLKDFDDSALFNLIDNAITETRKMKERGELLIKETVSDIKAKPGKIEVNGYTKEGYLLTGRKSGSTYFIENDKLTVYRKDQTGWNMRCVVDDSSKQRIYEDRLANRLVNIYNEPTYIHTL